MIFIIALTSLWAMKAKLIILTLLCACTGCQTAVEYNNTKRLTAHPQFPKAAFHAPDFTRETLRTIADLEYQIERGKAD